MNEIEQMRLELELGRKPTKIEKVKSSISIFFKHLKDNLEKTGAIITGKKLAVSKKYEGAPRVTEEEVELHPEKWIIEECIPACRILWSKNIYTFMCSDPLDENSWIELKLSNLSEENLLILEEIKKRYVTYQYHHGCINIEIHGKGKKAQEELMEMASLFVMQDVPDEEATITIDEILIELGCSKKVKNPNFRPFEEQLRNMDFSNWGAPLEEEYLVEVDRDKMTKTEEEYISEYGAIKDEGKIYISRFHYSKHIAWNIHTHKSKEGKTQSPK